MPIFSRFRSMGRNAKGPLHHRNASETDAAREDDQPIAPAASKDSDPCHAATPADLGDTSLWTAISQQAYQMQDIARRMDHIPDQPVWEPEVVPKPRSRLERLPEEILFHVLQYLDHASLYRVSQISEIFLKISFDKWFEEDAGWRTFRHTVDSLNGGLQSRLLRSTRPEDEVVVEHESGDINCGSDKDGGF